MEVKLESSWKQALADEFSQPYFAELAEFVKDEYQSQTVYPQPKNIFRALDECPLDETRVVIIGQDPYHGAVDGQPQAQGLSFAVPSSFPLPPSLKNIFKELQSDIGGQLRQDGDLSDWAEQGVLLLNATLTVRAGQAGSHQRHGWEQLTDAIIKTASDQQRPLVFILWGGYARGKKSLIDTDKHKVIESVHPSPLSAHRGFFGSQPFSQANDFLVENDQTPIKWLQT